MLWVVALKSAPAELSGWGWNPHDTAGLLVTVKPIAGLIPIFKFVQLNVGIYSF